jgi:membrane-associated phospholipid phosphatase
MRKTGCWILLVLCYCNGFGQADLPSVAVIDTLPPVSNTLSVQHKPFIKTLIIPSAAFLYGVVSLQSGMLQDWNLTVQKNVMAPNGQHTNIDNYLPYLPSLAGHVLSLAGIKGKHKFFDRLLIDGIAGGFSVTSVYVLKRITKEKRPDGSDDLSFPSNHVATAFASAELLRAEYSDVSPWYGIAGYTVAATTAYLRMYNNEHWFGDVVAAAGIGIISAKLANQLYPLAHRILFGKEKPVLVRMP